MSNAASLSWLVLYVAGILSPAWTVFARIYYTLFLCKLNFKQPHKHMEHPHTLIILKTSHHASLNLYSVGVSALHPHLGYHHRDVSHMSCRTASTTTLIWQALWFPAECTVNGFISAGRLTSHSSSRQIKHRGRRGLAQVQLYPLNLHPEAKLIKFNV